MRSFLSNKVKGLSWVMGCFFSLWLFRASGSFQFVALISSIHEFQSQCASLHPADGREMEGVNCLWEVSIGISLLFTFYWLEFCHNGHT